MAQNTDTEVEAESIRLNNQEPWPGLRTFSENNADFFFGREQEIDTICRMVKQETLSILFGKSGLGKSSILQAGISPKLRSEAFIPIYIRLNHHEETLPLEDQVEVFIEETIASFNIDAPAPIREETLWEYFHKKRGDWWSQENQLLKPVLIFDQFEEILTTGHENSVRASRCISFLTELEDLIENRPPEELSNRFKQEKGLAKNYDLERMDYRVILSLREDYLADFEGLRERLRPIMQNRYRLLPMTSSQAVSVILEPGGNLVDDTVAEKIIDFVSSSHYQPASSSIGSYADKRLVEPALLCVILRELNNHRIRTGEKKISSALVTGKHPEEILYDFYEQGIKGLGKNVSQFIEQQLLTASGARNRIAEEDAVSRFGLSRDDISSLINKRIIQRDRISQMSWLELSHDTLAPIVKRTAEINLLKKRRWRTVSQFSVTLFAIAVIGIAANLYQARERELQTGKAAALALEITEGLENSSGMLMSNKQQIIDRLNDRFKSLRDFAKNSESLKIQQAIFHTKVAKIQLAQGYYGRATHSALLADKLIFKKQHPGGPLNATSLEKASIKLLLARTFYYSGNYSKTVKNLDIANQLIQHSQSENNPTNPELAIIELQSNRLDIDLLLVKKNISKAVTLLNSTLKKARELASTYTNNNSSDKNHLRRIYIETYHLYSSIYALIRGYSSYDTEEIYAQIESDFKNAEPFFKTNDIENWHYIQSLKLQLKALMQKNKNQTTAANTSHSFSINSLLNLVRNDNENLRSRYLLGKALLRRVDYAISRDSVQAKLDLESARSIAATLKRDSNHQLLACTLNMDVDHFSNRYNSLHNKPGKSQPFSRLIKRIDHCRNEIIFPNISDDYKILAYYYQIQFLSKDTKNVSSRSEAMRLQNLAFSLLDNLEAKEADKIYLSIRRYYMHAVILNSDLIKFIDDNKTEERLLSAIKQVNLLLESTPIASEQFSGSKLWLLGEYAIHLLKTNRQQEAIKTYQKITAFGIKQTKLYPHKKTIVTNSLWGITQLIKIYDKKSLWLSAIEASDLLFQLYDPRKKEENIPFPKDMLQYWKDSHKTLDALKGHLLEPVTKNNTISKDSKTILEIQTRLEEILSLSSMTMKQLQVMSTKKQPSNATIATSTLVFDPKQLKIKPFAKKENNVYVAKEPLGWTTAPFYSAPWSYTITGDDLKPYSHLADKNQKVERVRITQLPFYKKGRLLTIELVNQSKQYNTRYYLESKPGGDLLSLAGTSPNIHKANKNFPIRFRNPADAVAYLRFFTTFVQGEEGSFLTVESIDEIPWSDDVPTEEKQKIANLLRPAVVWQDDKNNDFWYATATVNYSNALYHAKYKIKNTGMIEMLNDFPVASNLSINPLNMTGNTGRTSNFVKRISLDITRNINVSNLADEINYLLSLVADTSDLSALHKTSLINEALLLLEAQIETDHKSIDKSHDQVISLQKFLKKESNLNNRIENSLNQYHLAIAKNQSKIVEKLEKNGTGSKDKLRQEYLVLSFYQLFAKDFKGALSSAKKGIDIDNNNLPSHTNYAHALLFLGKTDEALAIYRKHKDKLLQGKTFNYFVLDDFEQLESTGITHPLIKQIREELTKKTTESLKD